MSPTKLPPHSTLCIIPFKLGFLNKLQRINLIVQLTTAKAVKVSPEYVFVHFYYALKHTNEKKQYNTLSVS